MHSAGNDYVFVDCFNFMPENPQKLAQWISNRRLGIGSDGLILILPSEVADCEMRIFNSDGSEGLMCGNGIRCVGNYIHLVGYSSQNELSIDTLSGVKKVHMEESGVGVDMGVISDYKDTKLNMPRFYLNCTLLSIGNPHCVIYVDAFPADIVTLSKTISTSGYFKDGINIEYVKAKKTGEIICRVYERGSGITASCGSGACAVAYASMKRGIVKREVWNKVSFEEYGDLEVKIGEDEHVWLRGEVEIVYEGTFEW